MEMQINSQQHRQPDGTIHGNGFPDPTNIYVQTTGTSDSQQHAQPTGKSYQISVSVPLSSDQTNINVQTTRTPRMTPEEQAARKKENDKRFREKKKKERIEMESKLKEFDDENKKLKKKIADLIQNLQSKTEMIEKLKSDLDELKQQSEKESAIERKLLKIKDFKMFINEGTKHYKEPTQNQFPSDEERHSEELLAAARPVAVEGDDSGDENGDSKKKKKRAAPSAPSGRRSGKVPRVEDMDDELIETGQVTSAAKRVCFDARAHQRQGSTSNPTAMVTDPYSITECLRILNTMGGIPYSIVKKAKAKFESQDEREYFVGLTDEDWRRGWVKDLEDS
ncbi:hypothetical protein SLEP1_g34150 [Rubroshorea leprosula]|nr:hypothetical protein SLEP1_g34150 [Rubroshorea leprosula]